MQDGNHHNQQNQGQNNVNINRYMDRTAAKNDQVEEILGKNIIDGQIKFQVKWKKSGQYTWETVENLQNNIDLLSEFIVYEEQIIRKRKLKFEMELMDDLNGSDNENKRKNKTERQKLQTQLYEFEQKSQINNENEKNLNNNNARISRETKKEIQRNKLEQFYSDIEQQDENQNIVSKSFKKNKVIQNGSQQEYQELGNISHPIHQRQLKKINKQ